MKASKYLDRFNSLQELSEHFTLIGDYILVEQITLEERKTTSGIILNHGTQSGYKNTSEMDLPVFVHILSVGQGFYDEDTGDTVENTVKPGDICLIGRNSVRWFSDLEVKDYMPYEVGLTKESEIQLVFKGKEGYQKVIGHLNSGIKAEVQ